MKFHQFDWRKTTAPLLAVLRDIQGPRTTIAAFERAYHSPLYLRAQCSPHYAIYRGRA